MQPGCGGSRIRGALRHGPIITLPPIPQDPNILFLGNSLSFVNDLPGTFKALAESGGFTPGILELSDGGYHLSYRTRVHIGS